MATLGTVDLSSDSEANEVQIITRWDVEVRKESMYKIAKKIFLTKSKYDATSLTYMRGWFDTIHSLVNQPPDAYFRKDSTESESFWALTCQLKL